MRESLKPTRNKSVQSQDFEDNNPYSMTEDILIERASKHNRGTYRTQFYGGITVSIGALCFGFLLGWSSPAIRTHFDKNQGTEESGEYTKYAKLASLVPLGCCFGNMLLSMLIQRNGPRTVMLVVTPFQFVTWLLITITDSYEFRLVMIFLCGFFSVMFVVCGEILLVDYVHMGNLYHLSVIFKSSVGFGILLAYIFGFMGTLSHYYSGVSALMVALQFVFLFFCPESPVFLYDKNPVKAEKALIFFRGSTNIHEDMRQIIKDSELRTIDISAKYMLFKRVVYKAILRIVGLGFFQSFSGYYAFLAYNICIWTTNKKTQLDIFSKFGDGILLGFVYYLSSLISALVNVKVPFGVRKPLIVSSVLVTTTLSLTSLHYFLIDQGIDLIIGHSWIRLALQTLFIMSYEVGYSWYPTVILFDYLPSQIYPYVKTFTISFNWFLVYVVIRCTLLLQENITASGTILILAVISFFGTVFCSLAIIECKGKTLKQIQMDIGGNPVGTRSAFHARFRNYSSK